jgi:peptidyl-prolyl cis-trans isomerase SurA
MKSFIPVALISIFIVTTTPLGMASPSQKTGVRTEVVIDGIVASVDDKPITLSDLSARITPRRKLSMDEASKDPEALKTLDQLIVEKLLEEEAKAKRLSVADSEVDDYIREVEQRNGLSQEQFNAALSKEGHTRSSYRNQVKFDILKAKLASSITRGGVSTTDNQIDEYIANHPELRRSGATLKLHHISISKGGRTQEAVAAKVTEATSALDGGESFTAVAQRISDSAGSPDGSLLGVVAQQDLSADIAQAVAPLAIGEHSKPLESENEVQIFFVEERFEEEDDSDEKEEALRAEVRQILQKQKTKERLSSYFIEDLYKNHAVDKRL